MRFFRTGRLIFSILSVALVALPSAASAAPKPDNRCLRLAHSKHVVKLSESGVVLDYDFADPKSPLYGCLFSTEKVRKLEPTWGTNLALEGRYAAYYSEKLKKGEFQFPDRVYVHDLVTGRIVTRAPVVQRVKKRKGCINRTQGGPIALTRDGAVAFQGGYWYLNCKPEIPRSRELTWEIIRSARPGAAAQSLDSGLAVERDSLTKSGRSVVWRHGKARRSAFLGAVTKFSNNDCLRAAQQKTVTTLTADGALYLNDPGEDDGTNAFGCLFSTQRSHQLTDSLLSGAAMSGPYVAYFTWDYDDPFGFVNGFAVSDLRSGEVVSRPRLYSEALASAPGNYCAPVSSPIVLREDGAVAFSSGRGSCRQGEADLREVTTVPAPGAEAVRLDQGEAIDPESLRASSDGQTLMWINGDQKRSAPFGPR